MKKNDNKHIDLFKSPFESKVDRVLTPFQEYINSQAASSLLLLLSTVVALLWASIPQFAASYEAFTHLPIGFSVASFTFVKPLHFWVNEFLLSFFFFLVGLEIKREFLVGELRSPQKSLFIIFGAIGGMLIPAAIYLFFNYGTPSQHGWGIPMATDIAFALGILACFRSRLPEGIYTFLAALAIIDDIGAIIVIAIFYTDTLNSGMLLLSFILCAIVALMNYAGVRKFLPYLIVGFIVWVCIALAGIHGTIAGILVAFLVPARPEKGPKQFTSSAKELIEEFEDSSDTTDHILHDADMHKLLERMQVLAEESSTPLQRWESRLERPIALFILPIFALVNAGVTVNFNLLNELLAHPTADGILFGLLIGKPVGVLSFSYASLYFGLGRLPKGVHFYHMLCAAILTGIGFTMSLFITSLTFSAPEDLLFPKAAVLLASLSSAIIGILLLSRIKQTSQSSET